MFSSSYKLVLLFSFSILILGVGIFVGFAKVNKSFENPPSVESFESSIDWEYVTDLMERPAL